MNSLEHLQRVLPKNGLLVTTIINSHDKDEKPDQRFHSTVDALVKYIATDPFPGWEVYYGISSFKTRKNRKQDNVLATRVLALDVDCGVSASGKAKPYPTWREGLIALRDFVSVTGLPDPMVVLSGHGLHAYWILDEDLPPERWQPLAEALKLATVQHNFKVDFGLIANSSLVLRPVGTMNYKHDPPTEVRLLIDRGPYPVADIATVLPVAPAGLARPVNGKHFGQSKLSAAITGGNESTTIAEVVVAKCQQIRWGVTNQKDVDEPFWYAMLGVAGYCTEPDATAIEWSKEHADYNEAATLAKMQQWKANATGPAGCDRFERDRPGGCKGCKFKGITTPAHLSVHHQTITVLPEGLPVLAAKDIEMPKPFRPTVAGVMKVVEGVDLLVCPYDVRLISYGVDESKRREETRFTFHRKTVGWCDLTVPNAQLMRTNLKDFATTIGNQGFRLTTLQQIEWTQDMMRAYMDRLSLLRGMTNYYSSMGWKDNNQQFVIGDKLLRRNDDATVSEETTSLTFHANDIGYTAKGTLESSVDFTRTLATLDMCAHMFTLCVSLSAPLYKFTGLHGLTLSLYGTTGSGKTLAQLWAQSLWGNPELLHLTANCTQNALYKRIGTVGHMPVTVDEVTMMDSDKSGVMLFTVSQGRDKMRLNRNSEEMPSTFFDLPLIVSTNFAVIDKLQAASSFTEAQLARLLEVEVLPNEKIVAHPAIADKIRTAVTNNYGHIGQAFIKKLLELGEDAIKLAIDDAQKEFDTLYGVTITGKERYWRNMLTLAHLAGRWAVEWDLFKFDHQLGVNWALGQLPGIRHAMATNKRDALDFIIEFLGQHIDTAVYENHTGTRTVVDWNHQARGPIFVRINRWRDMPTGGFHTGHAYFDRKALLDHAKRSQIGFSTLLKELNAAGVLREADKKEVRRGLGIGTGIKNTGHPRVIIIDLKHERLRSILDPTVSDDDHSSTPERHLHAV